MVPSDRSQVHLPPVSAMRSLAPFGSLRGTPSRRARTGVGVDIAPGASAIVEGVRARPGARESGDRAAVR